jgi:hypothetical protein
MTTGRSPPGLCSLAGRTSLASYSLSRLNSGTETPAFGEQCTVVFALIVTESASARFVCGGGWRKGGGIVTTPPPLSHWLVQ